MRCFLYNREARWPKRFPAFFLAIRASLHFLKSIRISLNSFRSSALFSLSRGDWGCFDRAFLRFDEKLDTGTIVATLIAVKPAPKNLKNVLLDNIFFIFNLSGLRHGGRCRIRTCGFCKFPPVGEKRQHSTPELIALPISRKLWIFPLSYA